MILISVGLLKLLVFAGIRVDTFIKLAIAEGFSQEDVDDLDYMCDKISIYVENEWM